LQAVSIFKYEDDKLSNDNRTQVLGI